MGVVDEEQEAARRDVRAAVQQIREGEAARLEALKRARAAKLSISEMSKLAEVTRETIYRWLRD